MKSNMKIHPSIRPSRPLFVLLLATLAFLLSPLATLAQTAAPAANAPVTQAQLAALQKSVSDAQGSADNAWMLVSAALVLMMTGPGLALFYGGLVRTKNVLSVMMQSFAMMGIITVLWAVVSYSLAFGHGSSFIGGFEHLFLNGVDLTPNTDYAATIPHQTYMIYQLMFAIITPALITGAFAERMKFSAMATFLILWSIIVYSPMAHMVWGVGGLLNVAGGKFPCLDFAGGTVVHVTSGVSALVTALYLGKRIGYPKTAMPPHSMVLSFIGACLLWVGWFGFNAGSALNASPLATSAFVSTHLAAAAAAMSWSVAEWIKNGKPSALGAISGAVAGLVAITPASGFVKPIPGLIIGFIAGAFCFLMVTKIKNIFGYDDSLDAFGVHGAGGTLGALLTGVFASAVINPVYKDAAGNPLPSGGLEGNWHQLGNQAIGISIAWAISIVGTLIILFVVDKTIGLRVSAEDEATGLDLTQHGEEGYELGH
jgi:ammonium transporter, Amt family